MTSKQLINLIKNRRSIRKFTGANINRDEIEKIIEAGIWAPTGTNQQELRFIILSEPDDIAYFAKFKKIKSAKCVILIFIDFENYYTGFNGVKYLRHKRSLPFVDTGMCLMNMCLMAEAMDIKSVVLNTSENLWYDKIRSRKIWQKILRRIAVKLTISIFGVEYFTHFCKNSLGINTSRYIPAGAIALGYSDKKLDIDILQYKGKPVKRRNIFEYIIEKPNGN